MSELTERLLMYAENEFNAPGERQAMRAAAAEIERLTTALEVCDVPVKRQRKRIEKLETVAEQARNLLAGGGNEAVYRLAQALAKLQEEDNDT
jgi:hypothetical protein